MTKSSDLVHGETRRSRKHYFITERKQDLRGPIGFAI